MPSRTTWYILTPTIAISGLLLIVGLCGAWYVHGVNRQISDSLDQNLLAAQSAGRVVLSIRQLRLELHRYVDTRQGSHLEIAESSLGTIKTSLGDVGLGDRHEDVEQFDVRLKDLRSQPDDETKHARVRELIAMVDSQLLDPAEQRLAEWHDVARRNSEQNREVARRIGLSLLLLGVCGAVAGLLLGFGMAGSIHRSLVEISVPVRDIAGRLNEVVGPIKVSSNVELSQLDDALRILADKTGDVVRRFHESRSASLRNEQLAAVGQLAAGLAHELRNPLMSMKLIVQAAAERRESTAGGKEAEHGPGGRHFPARDLKVLEDEIVRLERMLQTFLDFARPPQPDKRRVDVGKLVAATLDVVRPRAERQEVSLDYHEPPRPLWIEADASQMRQVLINVLLNALDALSGGGTVRVRVARDSRWPEADEIAIRIADDGPGLSPELALRIFDPFVSTKVTGIGLGLSISRRIVQSHDGRIDVRHPEEGGVEFVITIPCPPADGPSRAPDQALREQPPAPPGRPTPQPRS